MLITKETIPQKDAIQEIDKILFEMENNLAILYNKKTNGKTNLALDYSISKFLKANCDENNKIRKVHWIDASNIELIKFYYRNELSIELQLECITNEFTHLCTRLKDKILLNENKLYLFIYDNVKNIEARDMILIWPENVKVIVTTQDEAVKNSFNVSKKKVVENILAADLICENIEKKIDNLLKHEENLLKWLVAFKQEFFPLQIFQNILRAHNIHPIENHNHLCSIPVDLKLEQSINSLVHFGFIDILRLKTTDLIKINNRLAIEALFKKEICIIEKRLLELFNFDFDAKNIENQVIYPTIIKFVEKLKPEKEFAVVLSNIYFKIATFNKSFLSDKQIEFLYLNKSLNLRLDFCQDEPKRIAEIKNLIGLYYLDNAKVLSDYNTAIELFKEALDVELNEYMLNEQQNNEISTVYANLGIAYLKIDDYSQSKFYLSNALMLCNVSNKPAEKATLYNTISVFYGQIKNYKTAIEFSNKSLELNNDVFELAAVTNTHKGRFYFYLSRYDEAIACFVKAEKLLSKVFSENQPRESKMNLYLNYGLFYKELGQIEKSNEYFEKADLIQKSFFGTERNVASNMVKSVKALQALDEGKNLEAFRNIEKSKNFSESLGINEALIDALVNEGLIADRNGNSKEALICYFEALELCYKFNKKTKMLLVLIPLATHFFKDMQRFDTSLKYYLEAYNICLEIYEENDSAQTAETCLGVAMSYFYLKDYEKCIEYGERGIKIFSTLVEKYKLECKHTLNQLLLLYFFTERSYGLTKQSQEKQILYLESILEINKKLLNKKIDDAELQTINANSTPEAKIEILRQNISFVENYNIE